MNGSEHYEAAEALIKEASKDGKSQAGVTALLARAQVHATLSDVYAHNRDAFELQNLLLNMLDQIRELRESGGAL